jgi:hypothetical protein
MKRIVVGSLLLLALVLVSQAVLAQTEAETQARVPELENFHEVIYPMWHNAYANKDTALIRP